MNEEMKFRPSSLERKNLSRPWGVMHWDRCTVSSALWHFSFWTPQRHSQATSLRGFVVFSATARIQRNKRPQEDYRKDSTTAPCMGILCAGLGFVPSSTSLSFSCVLRGLPAASSSGSCSRNLQPSHQRKTRQTFGFQAVDRRGGGEDRQETWHHFVPVCWGPWFSLVQLAPGTLAQPMSRSSFHASI